MRLRRRMRVGTDAFPPGDGCAGADADTDADTGAVLGAAGESDGEMPGNRD